MSPSKKKTALSLAALMALAIAGAATRALAMLDDLPTRTAATCDEISCSCRKGAPPPRDCGDIEAKCAELARKNGKDTLVYCKTYGGQVVCGCATEKPPERPVPGRLTF